MGERRGDVAAYRSLLGSRVRAQTSYPTSFVLDVLSSVLIGITEFLEIYVVFTNIDVLGGLDVDAALMVFALSSMSFALAATVVGGVDEVPTLIRTGTIDALMLRPLPVLGQLLVNDVSLRRLGRAAFALAVLVVALVRVDVDWTPARAVLLAVTPLAGALIFAAVFVTAGAAQFWLIDGEEFTNAFTYGSGFAAQNPASLYPMPLRVFFSFVIPAAFTGYLPTVTLLGRPGVGGLPGALGWFLPVVAALAALAALAAWQRGLRHYTGAAG